MFISVASAAPSGVYYVTYTVTDADNNSNSVTLPLRVNYPNTTPVLSPISDLVTLYGQTAVFTIGVTDGNNNLPLTEDALRIDGLPASARKDYLRLSSGEVVIRVTLTPGYYDRGIYRVLIKGKDSVGAMTIAEMRLQII